MNLRDIKKDIEYVLGAFLDDCTLFATLNPETADAELDTLFDKAVDTYNELKDQVNAKAEGTKKAQFAAIRKSLVEKTDALYEELSGIVKKSTKA